MKIMKLTKKHVPLLKKSFYSDEIDAFSEAFINDQSVVSYIAISEEEAVGFIYGYILKRINSKPMLYIHSVDVREDKRGQGIGTLMMNEILQLKENGEICKVFLITNKSNEKAMRLYQKVGGNIPFTDDVVFEYK